MDGTETLNPVTIRFQIGHAYIEADFETPELAESAAQALGLAIATLGTQKAFQLCYGSAKNATLVT